MIRLTDAQVVALAILVRAGQAGAGAAPSTQAGRLNGATANSLVRKSLAAKGRDQGRVRYYVTGAGERLYAALPAARRSRLAAQVSAGGADVVLPSTGGCSAAASSVDPTGSEVER